MIKLTGPPELQPLSLGKLSSFVQKALNQNILIYYKTLLIKNNQFDAGNSNASQEAKNGKRVETIKEQILALLKENKNGLSLAQIPLMLKNKYKKTYNIQSLGFPKLKNLLVTMDEVDLEKTQGNLLKAVLKSHVRKNSEKQLEEQPQKPNNLGGKKFLTLKSRPLDHRLTSMPYYIGQSPAGFSQDSAPPTKSYRTLSNVGDYILKVQMMLLEILQLNPFGIEVTKLNSELDKRLGGTGFQCAVAQVDTFQEFLITHLGDYLDIEVKKSLRSSKVAGPLSHIVYPKNYKPPNPPKAHFFQEEHTQDPHKHDALSNLSPPSYAHHLQSPDASFINNLKPFMSEKGEGMEADVDDGDSFPLSYSFQRHGRSVQGDDRGVSDNLSQIAHSTELPVTNPANTHKVTRQTNQYTHFGKNHIFRANGKDFRAEYKSGFTHRSHKQRSPPLGDEVFKELAELHRTKEGPVGQAPGVGSSLQHQSQSLAGGKHHPTGHGRHLLSFEKCLGGLGSIDGLRCASEENELPAGKTSGVSGQHTGLTYMDNVSEDPSIERLRRLLDED